MSTKATIQSLINENLADASNITASEHRAVESALLNEFYSEIITETEISNTVTVENTNPLFDGLGYTIKILKQGRLVNIVGNLENNSLNEINSISENAWFFEIVNNDYKPENSSASIISYFGDCTTAGKIVYFEDNKLNINSLGIGEPVNFKITYFTAS